MAKSTTQTVYLFNCDKTFKLDSVETLLLEVNGKCNFKVEKFHFRLNQMEELCKTTVPRLQMDFAVFVVHAHESRLSINEDNAGIGYAKIYRALLGATGDKVLIVIGGDDNYKDEEEKAKFVISRWARRKVASQFREEYLDGRKSFILSWSDRYRAIHVEALLHFLDTTKSGQKFEYVPTSEPVTSASVINIEREEAETHDQISRNTTASSNTEGNYLGMENEKPPEGLPLDARPRPKQDSNSLLQSCTSTDADTRDFDEKPTDMSDIESEKRMGAACWESFDSMNTKSLSPMKKVLILGRDQSDARLLNELFPDNVLSEVCVFSGSPGDLGSDSSIFTGPLKSCFIVVEARVLKDELQFKLQTKSYECILESAKRNVDGKIVLIISDRNSNVSPKEENFIMSRIKELLDDKGVIFWWKGNNPQKQTLF